MIKGRHILTLTMDFLYTCLVHSWTSWALCAGFKNILKNVFRIKLPKKKKKPVSLKIRRSYIKKSVANSCLIQDKPPPKPTSSDVRIRCIKSFSDSLLATADILIELYIINQHWKRVVASNCVSWSMKHSKRWKKCNNFNAIVSPLCKYCLSN